MKHRDDPVLIGALGGSGTRAFSRVLRQGGVYMGEADPQEDAIAFSLFYRRHLADYLAHDAAFPPATAGEAQRDFEAALQAHLSGLEDPHAVWGAKNPRTMLMLPFWHERFPRLRFVHVIRNGLDMAYSSNKIQLRRFGASLIGPEPDGPDAEGGEAEAAERARAMRYWAEANRRAADYGERGLGDRYLRIRLEDLCDDPHVGVRALLDFAGVGDERRSAAAVAEVSRPSSIGRWRGQPAHEVFELVELGAGALERFGYLTDEVRRYGPATRASGPTG